MLKKMEERRQGERCAEKPGPVLLVCGLAIALLASGLLRLTVETDPQQLWAASSSAAAREKRAFDVRSHSIELYLMIRF